MTGWPARPVGLLAPRADPLVVAWCDEVDAAIDTGDVARLERAQAVFRTPRVQWAPPLVPTAVVPPEEDPVALDEPEPQPEPAVAAAPPAAPSAAPLRGAWARRARSG